MDNNIKTGQVLFEIDVPYELVETGSEQEKPLITYLHGYKQNNLYFRKKVAELLSVQAYHLFLQGPYPVYDEAHNRRVEQWGRAWYLYDGDQDQFLKSMEKTSIFIQKTVDELRPQLNISRRAVVGYSMGGYLAGYFTLSRPGYVDHLMVIGGRIKAEKFLDQSYKKLQVLHLHGGKDKSVSAERAEKSCRQLETLGADVTFKNMDEGHKLSAAYIKELQNWMTNHGYIIKNN